MSTTGSQLHTHTQELVSGGNATDEWTKKVGTESSVPSNDVFSGALPILFFAIMLPFLERWGMV
jgi:hypothetical protein